MRALKEQRDTSLTNQIIEHRQVKVAVAEKKEEMEKTLKLKQIVLILLAIDGNWVFNPWLEGFRLLGGGQGREIHEDIQAGNMKKEASFFLFLFFFLI